MKIRLGLLLILFCSPHLHAGCDSLIIGGWSKHHREKDKDTVINETHPALGLQCNTYDVAVMKNSFNDPSLVVAKIITRYATRSWAFGYKLGLTVGYEEYQTELPYGIAPIAQLVMQYKTNYLIVEGGFSFVSTVTFKVPLTF